MYAQQQNGVWVELVGNIVFSPTVYQTAESLTAEQRMQFNVYKIVDNERPHIERTQKYGEAVYDLINDVAVRNWPVLEKTEDEIELDRKSEVPFSVSMRQGRLAMLSTPFYSGTLLDVIESMLASIPDPVQQRAAKIDWEYAQEIRRDFPLVQQLTAQLGLTERQIDDLFVLACTL